MWDVFQGLDHHLNHRTHLDNIARLDGPHTNLDFTNIAGAASLFLHYAAMTSEATQRVEKEVCQGVSTSATITSSEELDDLLMVADKSAPTQPLPDVTDWVSLDTEQEDLFS